MGAPTLTFSMPFEGGEVETPRTMEEIPDAMVAAAMDATRGDGHVNLRFYHMLVGLNFKANNYNETHGVVIHGLRLAGTFHRSVKIDIDKGQSYPEETSRGRLPSSTVRTKRMTSRCWPTNRPIASETKC